MGLCHQLTQLENNMKSYRNCDRNTTPGIYFSPGIDFKYDKNNPPDVRYAILNDDIVEPGFRPLYKIRKEAADCFVRYAVTEAGEKFVRTEADIIVEKVRILV